MLVSEDWVTVAPLLGARFQSLELPFQLDTDVALETRPPELDVPSVDEWLRRTHGEANGSLKVPHAIVARYTAASLGDPDPDSKTDPPGSKQHRALINIRLANLGLWLARPSAAGFSLVADISTSDETLVRSSTLFPRLLPLPSYASRSV